jgi:hypothetical protein
MRSVAPMIATDFAAQSAESAEIELLVLL